jgi:tRNA threonylcarbamoyl adenosine modification protein YjeE
MKETFEVTKGRLSSVAEKLLTKLVLTVEQRGAFVALHGDLGSGKTAFVKEVAKALGIKEDIISPTFILKKEYEVPLLEIEKLIHVDAYRLTSKEESKVLLLEEDKQAKNIVFIEWPEHLEERKWDAILRFNYVSEDIRRIEILIHEK